jgi:hypothetical protein
MEPETYISITALHMQDITVCCVSKIAFVSVHSWLSFWVPLMFISLYIEYLFYNKSSLKYFNMVHILWDDDEARFVLDQYAEFDFHSASSLKQQSAGRHISLQSDKLFSFRSYQSLFFLLNVACLAKKHQMPML